MATPNTLDPTMRSLFVWATDAGEAQRQAAAYYLDTYGVHVEAFTTRYTGHTRPGSYDYTMDTGGNVTEATGRSLRRYHLKATV